MRAPMAPPAAPNRTMVSAETRRRAEDDRCRTLWREPEVGKLGHRGCRLRIGVCCLTRELLRDRMELLVEFTAVLRAPLNYRFRL